jgi:hypothetical protein
VSAPELRGKKNLGFSPVGAACWKWGPESGEWDVLVARCSLLVDPLKGKMYGIGTIACDLQKQTACDISAIGVYAAVTY